MGTGPSKSRFHDLGLRLVSGVVLASVAFGLIWIGGWGFTGLVGVGAVLMSWEWGRIVRGGGIDTACVVHALAVAIAVGLAAFGQSLLAAVVLGIGSVIVMALTFGTQTLLSSLGVLYVGIPAVALIVLRLAPSYGLAGVLLVMLVVWTVDTAAFVGGRSIGGPKLWPSVSPNKTWAGFVSGVGAGTLMGAGLAWWLGAPRLNLALVALVLGIASQAGDLAESALKRAFGVKDSSGLIPGHGGVLDRLDGIVPAATLAGIIGLVANIAEPARALLFGG